jgi:hypothetical protein
MNNKLSLRAVLISTCLALAAFSADAAPGGKNSEPAAPLTVTGTPHPDASVGTAWRFQPEATGGDHRTLRWRVANSPAWASFDTSTGLLAGTPAQEHAGTFSGVRISASQGGTTATLPEFSVTIHARHATTGSAELSWDAPTERTDGVPIGELAGYRVLYGTTSGKYDQFVLINNPSVTQYLVEQLAPGTWYFAVTAITADQLESVPSEEVTKSTGG